MPQGRSVPHDDKRRDGRRVRGDKARAVVLECALRVASVEGLEGLTFGKLAEDVGVSKSNLTVLFGDKESLQLATVEASAQHVIENVVEPAMHKKSPLARLRALCDGWFTYVERRDFPGGCLMYATAHEYRARPGALRDRAIHNLDKWRRFLGRQMRDAQIAGALPADFDVRRAVIRLVSYQNTAHLALMIGDDAMFREAWRLTREYLREVK